MITEKCVTITEKRVAIWSSQETCIRHWWKRVMMEKTWHDYGNPNLGGLLHKQKHVTIYLNRVTILGAVIYAEDYSENKGYELRRAKCDFET